MAALPNLITVAQFRDLPEGGEYAYELHHGEVVALTRPKIRHTKMQVRLSRLLELKLKSFGEIIIELPHCPLAEFEVRAGDVAVISRSRWDASDSDGYLAGAPDLVIEVRSPSNTRKQLLELAALCLANGAREFWVVDPDTRTVSVMGPEGSASVYDAGGSIPLAVFGGGDLAVDEVFG
ncbi:MAG: Uma2 family endonuclease [Candidatus Sulfopaludibacter sp.]|nr:Uma2 family endonuclease [Candidatus Sulfopaludibacter sp.]